MVKQVALTDGGFDSHDSQFLGSEDRRRLFAARSVRFKAKYYWNVISAFVCGWIAWRSCWGALWFPYSALASKKGGGMVLVCPEAIEIEFGD